MKNRIILFYNKNKEIINYFIVGVITTSVSLGSYWLVVVTILDSNDLIQLQIANIISWILAIIFSYFASRKYVFKSDEKNIKREMLKFYIARVGSLIIDMFFMFVLVTLLKTNDKIAKIIIQIIIFIINYILSKLFVFKKIK